MLAEQQTLFADQQTKKVIKHLSINDLVISEYNPRKTRADDDIHKLAQRISRNGFEITRALWVYKAPDNGHYKVFAGGNRLEAAKRAGCHTIPVVVHEGYTIEQIVGLADVDNENDEYHTPVSVVDMWLSYRALADSGWTQQRIAQAKGVSQAQVAKRLSYAELPASVLAVFIQTPALSESHASELSQLFNLNNWLSRESAMLEVIDNVIVRTKTPTAKQFSDEVAKYNAVLKLADDLYKQLPADWNTRLVDELAKAKARTQAQVQAAYKAVNDRMVSAAKRAEQDAAAAASAAEAERVRLEREQERNRIIEEATGKIVCSDALGVSIPYGTNLLMTDPPYGMDFQSNRRVVSEKAAKIANDTPAEALSLLAGVLNKAYPRMAENSTLLVWTGWKQEPEFRTLIEQAGFTVRGSLIWNKPNHGSGDLEGCFAPKHERIIHAVKGNPKLNKRLDDVLAGVEFINSEHPTRKPVDLTRLLIEAITNQGELVADTFAGSGATVKAAIQTGRDFWACEMDNRYHKELVDMVYQLVNGSIA